MYNPRGRNRLRAASRTRRQWTLRRTLSLETLENRRLLASDLTMALQAIVLNGETGARSLVDAVHDRVFDNVLTGTQPVIKDALKVKDQPEDQLNMLSAKVFTAIESLSGEVTSSSMIAALTSQLGPLIRPGMPITATCGAGGGACSAGSPANAVNLMLHVGGTVVEKDTAFDLGLPSLITTTSGTVHEKLTYQADLVLGFSESDGVYLDTATPNDVRMTLDVMAPAPGLSGRLGILRFNGTNAAPPATLFHAMYSVDVMDSADSGTLLIVSEIPQMQMGATRTGDVTLNTHLVFDMGTAVFPTLAADLSVGWHIDGPLDTPLASLGQIPTVAFSNVTIDVGGFFANFVRPIADKIDNTFGPLDDIVSVLTTRIPVLSDIGVLRSYICGSCSEVTPLSFLGVPSDSGFVKAFRDINTFIRTVGTLSGSGTAPLGSFAIGGDIRTISSLAAAPLINQVPVYQTQGSLHDFLDSISNLPLKFPLLTRPESAFEIIAGHPDVSAVTLDMPALTAEQSIRSPTIPILGPLGIWLEGHLKVALDLDFGYDSSGLALWASHNFANANDVFEGFYIVDNYGPEALLEAGITAFGGVDLAFVQFGVGGGVTGTVTLDLHDPNNDGRIHPREIIQNLQMGPLCLFDFGGSLDAKLTVYARFGISIFSVELSYDIVSVELVSFDFPCSGTNNVPWATLDPDTRELTLNMGPRSVIPSYIRDENGIITGVGFGGDESVHISKIGTDETTGLDILQVEALGVKQIYTGVRSIFAEGGSGNDVIQIDANVRAPATLYGGFRDSPPIGAYLDGDDLLVVGGGGGEIHGGPGNDELGGGGGLSYNDPQGQPIPGTLMLYGDEGDDLLHGSQWADILFGGDGNDQIFAGLGDDILTGGEGEDLLVGGEGNDLILGGGGNDDLRGEDGDDEMHGGDPDVLGLGGDDILRGGEGNNRLYGDGGDDVIYAFSGNDMIWAGAGADFVAAGGGNDTIHGDAGDDEIHGEAGLDFIYGDEGMDSLHGEDDFDTIYGGAQNDTIAGGSDIDFLFGDDGDDWVHGNDGDDIIKGGTGNDTLFGLGGSDTIYGEEGNDTIFGGTENDVLIGGANDDSIAGDEGDDTLTGDDGNDSLFGGAGNDLIWGYNGNDQLFGEAGNDRLVGGLNDDTIRGGSGNDVILGDNGQFVQSTLQPTDGNGNDVIFADDGDDLIYGQDGGDAIEAGSGFDTVFAGAGIDVVHGGADDDLIYGESGDDWLWGEAGADVLDAGPGFDLIYAGTGSDRAYGGDGNDTIYGFAPLAGDDNAPDWLYGGAGNDTLDGQGGDDYLAGDAGVDTLRGGSGNDTLLAGTGIGDQLFGEDGNDDLLGSDDGSDTDPNFNDAIYFGDVLDGGAGDDTIRGLGGADRITAGAGNDWVDSGLGSDLVLGGAGDDYLYAGHGTGESISGEAGDDTIYGSHEGHDTLAGGPGQDSIYGQGGNDTLTGDDDDDHLDGGTGTDNIQGGAGNDTLFGGGGVGDQLDGGVGNDVLNGSDDGADTLIGGPGRDTLFGNAGNDTLSGGDGDDLLDGGPGDDLISGDAGRDLLLGGADHDTLYGHSVSGVGDDNAVDDLYGDFGTNRNEPSSGRDRLYGQGGNDRLWGEGEDDFIDGGAGTDNLIDYGAGEGPIPSNFVPPTPTPPPAVQPAVGISHAGATLPDGVDSRGFWSELAGSGSGDGVSQSPGAAIESSLAVDAADRRYVAWADARSGNFEIYVARQVPNVGWQQLPAYSGQSASEGGISNTAGSSRRPQVAIDNDGNPLVAWTEFVGSATYIFARKFDPAAAGGNGAWVELAGSASGVGISGTGVSDSAQLIITASGPVVAWLDASSGSVNVFVKQFSGGSWSGLGGAAFAVGTGVSQSTSSVPDYAIATDGAKVSIAWTQPVSGGSQIYLREFNGATWNSLASSASGGGLSNVNGANRTPTAAYHGGQIFVAWQGVTQSRPEIHAKAFNGATWATTGSGLVVSPANALASQPKLASRGGKLVLTLVDDSRRSNLPSATIITMPWSGLQFTPLLGVVHTPATITAKSVESLNLALDSAGRPFVTWNDPGSSSPQVYLRANLGPAAVTIYYPITTVQNLLAGGSFGSGDIIYVDVSTPGFTVSPDDSGVTIIAKPGASITGPVVINGANDVTLQGITAQQMVTMNGGQRNTIRDSSLLGGVTLTGSTDAQIIGNTIECDGVALQGAMHPVVVNNRITTAPVGVQFQAGTSDADVRGNTIRTDTGVLIAGGGGLIRGNEIQATATGIEVTSQFTGAISENDIHGASLGVRLVQSAALDGNRIHDNATGIATRVSSTLNGLGFARLNDNQETRPNQIFANVTGVRLELGGVMQNQHVRNNSTGVSGTGSLVAADLDHANRIENNGAGVDIAGPVQFNYIGKNVTGIIAHSQQLISHNFVYRNLQLGIDVQAATAARIVSNTIYAPTVDAVRVRGNSREIEFLNNQVWAESGFALHVTDDSQVGFWSDYNLLHAGSTGTLVHWSGFDFTDILDWQADVATFDLHSRGRTVVNPGWSEPRFVDAGQNDFRTVNLFGLVRYSNPAIDAGDPRTDLGLVATNPANLLTNPSFASGLTGWTANAGAATATTNPTSFDASAYFRPGDVAVGFAEQTVDLIANGFSTTDLDSGDLVAVHSGRLRSTNEVPADRGKLIIRFLTSVGALITEHTSDATNDPNRWELAGDRVAVPAGARLITYRFEATRGSGTANDAVLDNAALRVHSELIAPDIGAVGNADAGAAEAASVGRHIAIRSPDLYFDWIRDQGHEIRWESYGNTNELPVKIDLYQDGPQGPQFLTNIVASTPDDGSFSWTPLSSGIDYGTYGLRMQVQWVGDSVVMDRSIETFSVPENTNAVFVNDRSATNDEFTAAPGNNRSTGRLASAPKPLPTTATRIYSIGPTQTLYVDNGTYRLFRPLVISNSPGVGDDEGFTIAGPTTVGRVAALQYANPLLNDLPSIDLNDADFMTISNLSIDGGKYGLWVHNGSENLVVNHVSASRAALDGIRFESTAPGSTLDFVSAQANGRFGISVTGPVDHIFDSDVGFNQSTGIDLQNQDAIRLEANRVHDNRGSGLSIRSVGVPSGLQIVGSTNLASGRGNRVYVNAGTGIDALGNIIVAGNSVSGQRTANTAGIKLNVGTAQQNVVWDNYLGIDGGAATMANRVYQNATTGIYVSSGTVKQNVVYSNAVGLDVVSATGVSNNLVYANSQMGVNVRASTTIANNTVYQTVGDAVRIGSQVSNVQLRNNILSTAGGYDIYVPNNSQIGFQSDFNLLRTTGNGRIGFWQGLDRVTLADWQGAAFLDANSLSQDPAFVDPDGADNSLGYVNATNDGRDDDFHEQSQFGSFHGGSLAPVIAVGMGVIDGLPVMPPATQTNDPSQSPAIDRGLAIDPFGNEISPNGGFINLGTFGNTSQASISPAQYVNVMRPDGGELWPAGQSFAIRWRSHDMSGNVKLELLDVNNALVQTIAVTTPNDGDFNWSIPTGLTPSSYQVRVTRLDAGMVADSSNATFTTTAPVTVYYVNDGSVNAGDWTTAPGNDANNGLTPATPKASLRALLDAYDFGPGDTIRIDDGSYTSTTNTFIAADDSGVTIEGFHDTAFPARKATLSRGSTLPGNYTLQFTGADDVTLTNLFVTGGEYGIVALNSADSDRITIRSSEIFGNSQGGIYIDASNDAPQLIGNRVYNQSAAGIQVLSAVGAVVRDNVVHDMTFGTGIEVRGASGVGTANIVSANDSYGNTYNIIATGQNGFVPVMVDNNDAHGGRFFGIQATGANVLVTNNRVYANTGFTSATGIGANLSAMVLANTIYDNVIGVEAGEAIVRGNRVFHNTEYGIGVSTGTVDGNVVYSNAVGIRAGTGLIRNNLVYANSNDGIQIYYAGSGGRIEQNTIYQPGTGDAIHVAGFGYTATNVTVLNNILSVANGAAVFVDPTGQIGFYSDYNDIFATASGKIGRFGNRDYTDIVDWSFELGLDQHSIAADPQFADIDGPDGQLGFVGGSDYGQDDDFRVTTDSPTIDAGDPATAFDNEPAPQGGRVNLGNTGNTAQATTSAAQFVQVLGPNGQERIELGQSVNITWRTTGLPAGTVDITLVGANSLVSLMTIAAGTADDGTYTWSVPTSLAEGSYRVRVIANQGILPSDVSDAPFLVVNAGQHYYVNDASTAGDVYTTAVGSNLNSGKSPAAPLASLSALLAAYDLDPGDVIHVDAGTYALTTNLVLSPQDSGVRIEGPAVAAGNPPRAILDRGNTALGSYVVQLTGADNVTLAQLSITGGEYGVAMLSSADSDGLTITNVDIYGNLRQGLYASSSNDSLTIANSRVHDNPQGGIYVEYAATVTVRDNVVDNNIGGNGIELLSTAGDSTISGNQVYGHGSGIKASSSGMVIQVANNDVHDNRNAGIDAGTGVQVIGNRVYRTRTGNSPTGIQLRNNASFARNNVVFDNIRGIDAFDAVAENNRVYHNDLVGISSAFNATMQNNKVYSNGVGIWGASFTGRILGNLIYSNHNDGIWLSGGDAARIEGNTIYQSSTGDAVQVGGPHPEFFVSNFAVTNTRFKDNILSVAQDYVIHVAADGQLGLSSDYNDYFLTGSGRLARWGDTDFVTLDNWYYELGLDQHGMTADPQFIDIDGGDNVLGYNDVSQFDGGMDDNFGVAASSPTIDAGDPRSGFAAELAPNGQRINLGHTGDTVLAATSPEQLIQVLSPNGRERFEVGTPVPIEWQSSGLTVTRPVALIDAGGPGADNWLADKYKLAGITFAFATPVDTSQVTNPAPANTYQVGIYGGYGPGNRVAYQIGAADGNYSIRLHFVEPTLGAGQRTFDIRLQGATVQSGYDIFAAAGGQFRATTLTFPTTAIGGQGVLLEMVDPANGYGAFVTGIELTAVNANGVANPTANVQVSTSGGLVWSTVASNVPLDRYGRGNAMWTPTDESADGMALVRIVANSGNALPDASDAGFTVANAGRDYYVNDGSTANDIFTTAAGSHTASGKRPDAPMRSLASLLAAYDLDTGDVIHVDRGTYRLYRNLVISPQDSGVRIEGPGFAATTLPPVAILDRGNTLPGNYVIELAGADDVTIDRLGLTGATVGVYAAINAGSDRLTLSNNDIYGQSYQGGGVGPHGIFIDQGNVDTLITGNRVHNNTSAMGPGTGITARAQRARVANNEVFGQTVGIAVAYNGSVLTSDWVQVTGNSVHDHTGTGIDAYFNALVTGNTVFQQNGLNGVGIRANQVTAMDNVVHSNTTGIVADRATVKHNRTYNNTTGIAGLRDGTIEANQTYSNAVGISGDAAAGFYGLIASNLVYGNTSRGISIDLSFTTGLRIINNTVYQSVGDGIRLNNVSQGATVRNNIVSVDAGYDIFVSANSQANLSSNYNLFHQGTDPNAHVGFWNGAIRDLLSDWQMATGQDANSLSSDPLWVDRDGPDNILGYSPLSGGVDGGLDDNFQLRGGSPAIDRADSTLAPAFDRDGNARFDDPGTANQGIPAGLAYVDLGAHEFIGNSADVTPPTLASSSILMTGTSANPTRQILLTISEPLNPFDALGLSHYELRAAGNNGMFGDTDDVIYALVPQYTPGSSSLTLTISNVTTWPGGPYRLTVRGSLHDRAGNALDGDLNGTAGGDYVRTNNRPVLSPIDNRTVDEQQLLTFAAATADDGPVTYRLASGAPIGASIDPTTGVFSWTPTEAQGPAAFTITVIATDAGVPSMNDLQTFTVTVAEVNSAPVIDPIPNKTVVRGSVLTFTVTASDPDQPANTFGFSLAPGAPAGATIDPINGVFYWMPAANLPQGHYDITVRAWDNGSPALFGIRTFQVTVYPSNPALADFDHSGLLNTADIDALFAQIAAGTNPPGFDLTGDGLVNLADRDAWLAVAGAVNLPSGNPYGLGDANLDGFVDGQDFIAWNSHKFTTNSRWSAGNFDANAVVDGSDFILWNQNKFMSASRRSPHRGIRFQRVTAAWEEATWEKY